MALPGSGGALLPPSSPTENLEFSLSPFAVFYTVQPFLDNLQSTTTPGATVRVELEPSAPTLTGPSVVGLAGYCFHHFCLSLACLPRAAALTPFLFNCWVREKRLILCWNCVSSKSVCGIYWDARVVLVLFSQPCFA